MCARASSVCRANNRYCLGMCEWTDCRPLPVPTERHPRPRTQVCEPGSSNQPHLPSERFQFSSEDNLLELPKDSHQQILATPQSGHSKCLTSGKKLEIYTILKIQFHKIYNSPVTQCCSIPTSPSLLLKLGKPMARFIHLTRYISYPVDYCVICEKLRQAIPTFSTSKTVTFVTCIVH